MSNQYHLAAITIANSPTITISQIENQDIGFGIETLQQIVDGQVDPTFTAINEMKPMFTFTCSDIYSVLTAISLISGRYDASDVVSLYFQPSDLGGTRTTTACIKLTTSSPLFCIESLKVQHNKPSTITCGIYPISSDGTTNPIAIATGQSLPAPSYSRAFWTMGPAYFNGTRMDMLEEWTLTMGKSVEHRGFDGSPFPTLAYIKSRTPTIALKGLNLALLASASLDLYKLQSSTDSLLYLRKYTAGGTRVADITASHISLSLDDGMLKADKVGGDASNPMSGDWTMLPAYDGTNAIVAVNTATAIS